MADDSLLAQILASLNRIELKVDSNHKETTERLHQHMDDEEGEIEAIHAVVQENRKASEDRHNALMQSIDAYMARSEKIETAFLKTAEGHPDLSGHHDDHHARRVFATKVEKWRDEAIGNVFKAGTLACVMWLLYQIWDALLRGPR